MPKKTLNDRKTRKLSRSGNSSYYITIPIEFIRQLDWRERQKIDISLKGNKLVVEDWGK